MKNSTIALLGGLLLASSAVQAAPKSYPMVCRGGSGTLGFSSYAGVSAAVMYIKKAPGKVSHGLNAGECAWVDRAIAATEPPCIKQTGVGYSAWIFPDQLQNSYFNSNNDNSGGWLRKMLKSNNYQTFQVYNPGNSDCFVVSKVGF